MPIHQTLVRRWMQVRRLLGGSPPVTTAAPPATPTRAQLLSAEQMERHGQTLARAHRLRTDRMQSRDPLLGRLGDTQAVFDRACGMLGAAARAGRTLTPAGDWLLDNIYLIEEQIAIARRHLPKGYSRELPRLAEGPSQGLPRVYDIALNAIAHSDGRVDSDSLSRFVTAYQSVAPLTLGELWAIPIMLRLALIENLRRVSMGLIVDRAHRDTADLWADELTRVAEADPKSLVLVIADMARSKPPAASAFVAELARRLQGQSSALALPLTWVEQWLADTGQTIEQLVQAENRQQAAAQVSVSNSIGSLRLLSMLDWREFVESLSLVERLLRQDPHGTYGRMDFATRDRYRHVAEQIARRARRSEIDVAAMVLERAQAAAHAEGTDALAAHVGYHLVDDGRRALEQGLSLRIGPVQVLRRILRRIPLAAYMLPMGVVVALCTAALLASAPAQWTGAGVWLLAVLCIIAFSDMGVSLVNWVATLLVTPRALPRLDTRHGIADDARTLVVVPSMFGSAAGAQALAEALEVRFLANRDENLRFALLTDFFDAAQASLPGDTAALEAAGHEIEGLNARYASEGDLFFLFHRPRLWNPRQQAFIGEERKRGKLGALNALLRGGARDAFVAVVGDIARLQGVRYVITLDTDTQLPRDAARELVGTLAHPLNRAVFDVHRQVVSRGYGILQPRVGVSMGGRSRSLYARLFGSEPGIDPYTRAVSDVYQDVFGEGSFVGKGIYDIDAFESALAGRMPDNCILSHDLLEGCYARAGLASDVQLYENYPGRYAADVKRRHRWIRGDWQVLPWILPWVPRAQGGHERNPLSMLSRGKLADNLRRSLVPAAMVALLAIGWLYTAHPAWWTLAVLSILWLPPTLASLADLARRPSDLPWGAHLRHGLNAVARHFAKLPVQLATLPYEVYFSLDAILRTLWRMLVSRRNLLQWSPSSEDDRGLPDGLSGPVRAMWPACAFALGLGAVVLRSRPEALWVAMPILLLWLMSPVLMWWLGRDRADAPAALSVEQTQFLRRLARRTWGYFETYVTQHDHWLAPDNVQEHPTLVVARRTSPTNIGLGLLADLAAWDFGYLPTGALLARIGRTLVTLQALPRHRGHFYNWYDTQTLQPLPPRYVSTVDSGNLAGHLLTLRQGLLALVDAPLLSAQVWQGLRDTAGVLQEARGDAAVDPALAAFQATLQGAAEAPPQTLTQAAVLLDALQLSARGLRGDEPGSGDAGHWAEALRQQTATIRDELLAAAPWSQPDVAPGAVTVAWPERVPTLGEVARSDGAAFDGGRDPVALGRDRARERIAEIRRLADITADCAQMDFGFLYDRARHLLTIGYNVDEHRRDPGYYDLLASEARLCSFVGIAQGQLPQDTWFALGRLLTEFDGEATLLSWSGSMFEYLMPQLVMPSFSGTLLDETSRTCVRRQIAYGRERNVPWGMSESAYNIVDARMNYQYRAFGVPGLGLKRGLAEDLVVAPYASMMAAMVAPEAACDNLQRLSTAGFGGRFGLYEAIDYTAARLPRGQDHALIRSFMAHHQGMGLLSLLYVLHDQPMQRRFLADPQFQATVLLLQERIPRTGIFHPHAAETASASAPSAMAETKMRILTTPDLSRPAVQVLSNGRYHVMVSHVGSGYSRAGEIAVTRWREDGTRDHWGQYCYLRDVANGEFWSSTYQPCAVAVEGYEAIFSDARAEFRGRVGGLEMHTEIAVSPEDDIELRRLHLDNRSREMRTIEVTSYGEVVLAPAIADELHPAFSGLFVQTELLTEKQAIVCTRRPRGHDETPPWMFHLLAVHDAHAEGVSYETDRARFIGRGGSLRRPLAMLDAGDLSGSAGSVLDPVVAIRARVTLAPGQAATIDMVTGVATARDACVGLVEKYRDRRLADRVFDLAWTHSQVVRRQINASQSDAQLYERLAGLVLYGHRTLRAEESVLLQNRRGQSGLWGQGISGDYPVVVLQIADAQNIELVRQLVQAHAYWRLKGLAVDLVIWNEDQAGYRQQLQDQIMGLVAAGVEAHVIDRPGGIFIRPAQQISYEDRVLLQTVARVIISDARGSLVEQVSRRLPPATPAIPLLVPAPIQYTLMPDMSGGLPASAGSGAAGDAWPFEAPAASTILDNGLGGFSTDGREYRIELGADQATPAPWCNVLANPRFGCVLSESSPGYTWAENAHEFRLTPWHNDPVADTGGEAFYLRDDDSGRIWSPTPLPCRGQGAYSIRHGFGYSVYAHVEDGISSELWIFVALDDAMKYSVLKLRNVSGRARRISATGYVEWVLGDLHARTQMHVVTEVERDGGAVLARNPYGTEFEGRVAFFDAQGPGRSISGDREEFLGRNGDPARPAALTREHLSGRVGAGLDPCAAIQVPLELEPGQSRDVVFRLGMGADRDQAVALARASRGDGVAAQALGAVRRHWLDVLGGIRVQTPEPSFDVLANGWLLYQTIGCRFLARSGFYQSGGAWGFRDQLQDSMAMLQTQPQRAREQLLLCAAHQFPQGDVLHWWHPPLDRGVRTRCSDDYLWLPLAACEYAAVTGDVGVFDERVSYIEGRPLNPGEESYYDLPMRSGLRENLYRHCLRAVQRALTLLGERGLPLIGSGDWNDGMNRVGEQGRGESVWLGFFLFDVLGRFSAVARARGDDVTADDCLRGAETLRQALEQHGWDGAWYRRAWFDNGAPLGSTASDECRIDSIAQSWSVLSGAGDPQRVRTAMDSLDTHLVRREAGLVQLLDPPFDLTPQDPGYIRGYVPGVRENGGQYTHAAIWAAMAFAKLGDNARAWELLRMINPVHHGDTAENIATYKVEPYVMAADVYAVAPHTGRGGWTWYTGSAGWMYRLMTESLLGLRREGDRLHLAPCIPADWPEYRMQYRFGETVYRIHVTQQAGDGERRLRVDGVDQPDWSVPLQDDGIEHVVEAWLEAAAH